MTELTKFADRKSFLADKSELTEEELAQLCELSEEDVDLESLETFTEKKFKELSEKEREDLAGRLLKAEYKKYKNCWISTSKLLYETPETLTKEAKALDVLGGLGYEAFLLPYGYARNNQKLFMKSADTFVKGRFLEMKTVVSKGATAGQSAYRDSRKKADSAFITYTEDISPHAAMESLWNYVNGAKAALDKAGKRVDFSGEVFLYFEKSGKTMLFEVSSDGKFSQKSVSDFGFKKAPPLEEGRVVEDVEAKPFEPPKESLQQNSNSVKGETKWEVPGAIEKWNAEKNGREGAFIPVSRLVKIIPENDAQVQAVLSDENYHVVFSDAARALLLMANYDETSFEFMLDPDSGAFVEVKRNPFEIVGTAWPDQMLGYLAYEINYRLENIEDFSSEKDKWAAKVLSPFIANLSTKAIENLLKSGSRPAAAEDVEYLLGKNFCSEIKDKYGVDAAELFMDEVDWAQDLQFVVSSEESGSKVYIHDPDPGATRPYMKCDSHDIDEMLKSCVDSTKDRAGDGDEHELKRLAAFKELLALRQGKEIKKENKNMKKSAKERKEDLVKMYYDYVDDLATGQVDVSSLSPEMLAGKWLNEYSDIYLIKYKSWFEVKKQHGEPSETEAKALEILQELFDSERIEKRISDAEGAAKKLGTWKGENPEKEIVDAFYAARDMGAAEFVQKISFEDLEALVLAKDAIQHGAEGLGFVRPNAEQMEAGWNYGYPFEVITTGYFVRKGPDGLNENVVKGMPEGAVYIEYADEMAVFSDDFEAASQWNKDNGEPGIFYSRDQLWFGDIKDTFQFPDIEENRASLKEWILEKPLEFDWKEFSKKKFEKLQKGVDSGKIPSGELGRVYLGSCAFDLSYDGNSNGMLSLQCWVLGEKGNDDNALIFGEEVPYTLGSELTFGFAKSFDGWSYSTFKDELQKKIFELVEAGNKSIDLVKECRRPNVDWSDERSVKAFYEKKKIEKVLEPWEKAVAEGSCAKVYPYDKSDKSVEAVGKLLSEFLEPQEFDEQEVRAVIDNLGDDECVLYVGTNPGDKKLFWFDSYTGKRVTEVGEFMAEVEGWAQGHAPNGAEQEEDLRFVENITSAFEEKERAAAARERGKGEENITVNLNSMENKDSADETPVLAAKALSECECWKADVPLLYNITLNDPQLDALGLSEDDGCRFDLVLQFDEGGKITNMHVHKMEPEGDGIIEEAVSDDFDEKAEAAFTALRVPAAEFIRKKFPDDFKAAQAQKTAAFVARLAEVSAKMEKPLAKNLEEFEGYALENGVGVSEEDYRSFLESYKARSESANKGVLTWDDICFSAMGTGFGNEFLDGKDSARYEIGEYAKKAYGLDVEEEDFPEEAIESFLEEHPELDRFTPDGAFIPAIEFEKKVDALVNVETVFNENKNFAAAASGVGSSFERQFTATLTDEGAAAIGLPPLGSKNKRYELKVTFGKDSVGAVGWIDEIGEYADGTNHYFNLQVNLKGEAKAVFETAVRAAVELINIREKGKEAAKEFEGKMVFLKDGELEISENQVPPKEPVKIVLKDRHELDFGGSDADAYRWFNGEILTRAGNNYGWTFEKELLVPSKEGGATVVLTQMFKKGAAHDGDWNAFVMGPSKPLPEKIQLYPGAVGGSFQDVVKAVCEKFAPGGNWRIESWSRGTDLTSHIFNENGEARDEAEAKILSYFMEDVRESCGGKTSMENVLLQAARKLDKYTPLEKEMLNRAFFRQGLDSSGKLKAFLQKGAAPERVPAKKRERDAWFGQSL